MREYTLVYEELDQYLSKLKVPYLGHLREAQNYVRAYSSGMGVLELPEYLAWPDWKQWEPIHEWLDSKRSQPSGLTGTDRDSRPSRVRISVFNSNRSFDAAPEQTLLDAAL